MTERAFYGTLVALIFASALPARAQEMCPFRFVTPLSLRASSGGYPVRWNDQSIVDIDQGCLASITWYYAAKADGSDRKRVTSQVAEDFRSDMRTRWQPLGQPAPEWKSGEDRARQRYFV